MRFVCVLLLAATGCGAQVVEGTVVDSLTGAGIPNAAITLEKAGKAAYRAASDAKGAFRIEGVAHGGYRANFTAFGFVAPEMNARVSWQILVDSAGARVDAKLAPAAKLSGRVIDLDERPVGGAEVALTVANSFVGASTTTDPNGAFHFNQVSPGVYLLSAKPPLDIKPPARRGDEDFGWVETFYPNVPEKTAATKITVAAGWEMPGQNIRLLAMALHRIRGHVANETGEPAGRATVSVVLASDIHTKETSVATAADGSFQSPLLYDGEWRISASGGRAGEKIKAFTVQQLAGRDASPIELRLAPSFTVQGTVEVPDGSAEPGGCVLLAPEEGGSGDEIVQACGGKRNFVFTNVFRRPYVITPLVFPKDSYYLDSVLLGDRDVTGQAVELAPGSPPVRITYKSAGGTLRGTVPACDGATVIAMPQQAPLRQTYFRLIRRAACTENGNFQIDKLRPGDYYVFAFDRDRQMPNEFATLDQALVNNAVSAHIREGETETVELRVTRLP